MNLDDLGWSAFFADAFEPYKRDDVVPARVVARHHGPVELLTERGPLGGLPAGRLSESQLPAVGDWVVARPLPGERKALIEAVLPRRTAFVRKEAWRRAVEQVVAANVDTVFITFACGAVNLRGLERYLTAAWESGAQPVVVLTKVDLAADPAADVRAAESVAVGVDVHPISSVTGEGLEALEPYLGHARTVALLGPSGVGKSTLVNLLAGREVLATQEIRADGRGRHTTSHRELVTLPGGALLVDTPGMRELQLWSAPDGLDRTFPEIEARARECRFADCSHDREPGCAIQAALADGSLRRERWESYRKLQRELRALELRQDARLQSEQRKDLRRMERELRRRARPRPR